MSEHNHEHHHEHHHDHHDHGPAHIHSHRNIIGFDEHGVPTVILKSDNNEGGEEDREAFIKDYMNAVSEYRKTFPSKQDVIEQTPDPAVREMLLRMEQLGIDTAFDRFDKQKPQCNFGLAGICCKICNMAYAVPMLTSSLREICCVRRQQVQHSTVCTQGKLCWRSNGQRRASSMCRYWANRRYVLPPKLSA